VEAKYDAASVLGLDRELLRAMRGSSNLREKVAEVFELLRDPVFHYLVTLLGSREEAEDLTQEAFLRLYRSLHRGQRVENVRAWVFWVARNLALNQRRNGSRTGRVDAETWSRLCERQLDTAPSAEQKVLARERFEKFQAALARLSPKERGCFELRAEGLGYREIAKVFGIKTPTLVSFLGRVIEKMIREIYD
jgi:RNA polymerase sigma-70 factor (ECF subfamily)